MIKRILYILCFLALHLFTQAQTATVRGFVYEEETGEPAIFTNVYLAGTTFGSSTDVNGYFLISQIPVGNYTLTATYLGYDTLKKEISLLPGTILNEKLFVTKSSVQLETVDIYAEKIESQTQTRTSVVKVTPKTIERIPTVGGSADLAQFLQVVPGVIFTGDQGGQLYIRGGSPIQNKVLLDGMIIYNPFHSIGLFSVFETDIIRNADIYTGGFNAEFGGRISSIMDITTTDGNKNRLSGKVSASTFGANLLLTGPIVKQKAPDKGSSSYVISVKNSYLDQSSKVFYNYVEEDGLPFNFLDIYGKASLSSANGSKLNFFGFSFQDQVTNYRNLADFNWNNYGGGMNFVVIPGNSPVLIEGNFAYSSYESTIEEVAQSKRSSGISGFNGGFDFTYFIGKNELKYGIEVLGFRTEFFYPGSTGLTVEQIENTTEIGGYGKYKATIGKLILEPGLRIQYYASLADLSLEPRLSMKYNVTDNFRLKFAGGLYSQNLIAANSDRDVVNLFYGFLSGPENLPDEFNGREITHRLQKAEHLILGTEIDLSNRISVNLEGYYKNFSQLSNLNRNQLFDENTAPPATPDILKSEFIVETGYAYGVDLSMKYDYKKWYLWAVYSYGWVRRSFEDETASLVTYAPHYDRRHNINLVASFVTGLKKEWEFSARWNMGSGFPFTQTQGYFEQLDFTEGINTNYQSQNGDLGIIYSELNRGRLPYYHRLDLDAKRKFFFSPKTTLEVFLGVTNLYDRENVFYLDRITNEVVYQLPIMPNFGLSFRF